MSLRQSKDGEDFERNTGVFVMNRVLEEPRQTYTFGIRYYYIREVF